MKTAGLIFGVPAACKKYGLEHNNPIERHNEDIKQRCKVMRSFKSYEPATAFLSLRRTIYNHARVSATPLGRRPESTSTSEETGSCT